MDASYHYSARTSQYARPPLTEDNGVADDERAFDRAAADLQDIIHIIATRYMMRGAPLTWRLLHEIESEALADLGLASRHEAALLTLFVRPASAAYPATDEPVSVRADSPVPLLFWFVLDVYGIPALSSQASRYSAAPFFAQLDPARLRRGAARHSGTPHA